MQRRTQPLRLVRQSKKRPLLSSTADLPPNPHPIRVFIADTHEVVRVGVRAILKDARDISVVGETGKADDVLTEAKRTNPDVILLKYRISNEPQDEICKLLCAHLPMTRIIVMTWNNDVSVFREVVETGVHGILLENIGREKLIQAIRTVAKGNYYLCQDGADKTFRLLRRYREECGARSGLRMLSPQERRILPLIAAGNTNKEIAASLVLSETTIKNYIASIFTKLDITSRTQAAALYLQAGRQHT